MKQLLGSGLITTLSDYAPIACDSALNMMMGAPPIEI